MPPEAPVEVGIATSLVGVEVVPVVEVAFAGIELEPSDDGDASVEIFVDKEESVTEAADDWRLSRVGPGEVVAFDGAVDDGNVAVDAVIEYRAEESTL